MNEKLSSAQKRALLAARLQSQAAQMTREMPLSYAQQALWFLHLNHPDSPAYNVAFSVSIYSCIDAGALRRALQRLVNRHELLRTTFALRNGEPVQIVQGFKPVDFALIDAREDDDDALRQRVTAAYRQPFDLENQPALRVRLFSCSDNNAVLLLAFHHIICDAWSIWLLLDELLQLYASELSGQSIVLPKQSQYYADYIDWQTTLLQGEAGKKLATYWHDQLAGRLTDLNMPTDRPRPALQTQHGSSYRFALPGDLARSLQALSKAEGATLYMTLLSAFQVLLYRYSGQTDILVGSPSAGRSQSDFAAIVGLFVNQLVLRGDLAGDPSFLSFLQQIRQTSLGALVHQDYPFYYLVQQLQPKRDPSRSPIFQSYFILQKPQQELGELSRLLLATGDETVNLAGLELQLYDLPQMEGQFDLTLEMFDQGERLAGNFKYNPDLFDETTIMRLSRQFCTLLQSIVADPAQAVSQLPLLTEAERRQLVLDWNATQVDYDLSKTLPQWLEEQVERTPEALAVVFDDGLRGHDPVLNYRQLNEQANQLAHRLQQLGVGPDVLVGVCLERSLDLVVALLAIIKAGGAYLPLDPSYPKDRLAFMLDDSNTPIVLTEQQWLPVLGALPVGTQCFCFDRDREQYADMPKGNPASSVTPEHLAYTIYTSGSTGKPKGAMNSHKAICNRLLWMQEAYRLTSDDRVLQKTPFSFDVSVWEFFWPLMTGACLVLAKPEGHKDSAYLATLIAEQKITRLHFVPSMLQNFLQETDLAVQCHSLTQVVCSGEALSLELQNRFFQQLPKVALDNLYGPTEAAIDVSYWRCRPGETLASVPIGKPIANIQLYLLDKHLQPVPVGVAGELHIGGVGLARGYLNRPELTAEKFISDPFSNDRSARLYKTGDLARYLSDGTIDYLGRLDHQVKIRGFRIELGEIENALLAEPCICEAAVTVDGEQDDKRLIAYIVPAAGAQLSVSELRRALEQVLPGFMVPALFIVLEALPLTASGKLDRRALPTPQQGSLAVGNAFAKPKTETEQRLAQIWQEVLKCDSVGIQDNFFELGGHSLLLAQVHRMLQQRFGYTLSLVELFQYPTIQALARHLTPGTAALETGKAPTQKQPLSDRSIAIVGMAGRFPGADTVEQFWQNLCEGVESIRFFSDDDLLAAGVSPDLLARADYVKANGALSDIDLFAAEFFDYTPREAQLLDPQQRLLLECAWQAVENAGYDVERLPGKAGVFAGVGMNSYLLNNITTHPEVVEAVGGFQVMIASDKDFLSSRIAYKLNLQGPAVTVQTACSTSLVAVHLACQSLLAGDCDMALAGGVSVRSRQTEGYLYQEGMILSPDGHCRAFDAKAQGTVGGNGAGLVVLKRLTDAMADNDTIYAVIKNSAVNNDGRAKVGYTAPGIEGQIDVISTAMQGIAYDSIGYIEAHGTGTHLGDPIEVAALTQAYRAHTENNGFCALGSLKTNVGHLDAAAGVAGIIKTALALKHQTLPPSLHFEQANPAIDFAHSPFFVNHQLLPWSSQQPRRAGVSSFGIGGTNAHIVLEEAPVTVSEKVERPHLLVISAQTPMALTEASQRLADFLQTAAHVNLADVAFTLAQGRKAFACRRSLVCTDVAEALPLLMKATDAVDAGTPSVVMMFSGQGAQYVTMALDLYRHEPVFREHLEACAQALTAYVDFDLLALLYPSVEQAEAAAWQLRQTAVTQPALFAVEYALAQLWRHWGIEPKAMLGHSIGEYVAACLAGVFSLADALMLVAKRGGLMQSLPGGGMLSVALSEQELSPWLTPGLALAAVNAPRLCVVSGTNEAIDALAQHLNERDIVCVRLHTSHAFHSQMMEPILDEFIECVKAINLQPPVLPYLSNVSGTWISAEQATEPAYWAAHLRQPVRFSQCVQTVLSQVDSVFLEAGPGQTLAGLVKQQIGTDGRVLQSLPHPQDTRSADETMLTALGELWRLGAAVNWDGLYRQQRRQRVPLPTYPFERQRYWLEATPVAPAAPVVSAEKKPLDDWFYVPSWQRSVPDVGAVFEPVGQVWLLFVDGCGLAESLAQQLLMQGAQVIEVRTGTAFEHTTPNRFSINPAAKADFSALFEALTVVPTGIVYAWPVTTEWVPIDELETVCLYSLLYLAQALSECNFEHTIRMTVLSNNMQPVAGEAALQAEKALLLGPVKVMSREYPGLVTQSIDMVWPQPNTAQNEKAVAQVYRELSQTIVPDSSLAVIAWRDHQRWIQTLEPVMLNAPIETRLKKQGVYLITGGLGGIGLVLASYLARELQAKLILTGRSSLPPREQWPDYLTTHAEDDAISRKIILLQQLEADGGEVLTAGVDVADCQQMQNLLQQAQTAFGSIDGVIHAAGVACGGMMQYKDPASMKAILDAKVTGSRLLADLFADAELDFLMFCSSLSALRGDFGQVDYCAANAFMDVLSHQLQRQGQNCLSVDWDTWQDVGMAANAQLPGQLQALHQENLKRGITPVEGIDVFKRMLTYGQAQMIVSTRDIRSWSMANDADLQKPQSGQWVDSTAKTKADYVAPDNEFEIKLAEIWQALLGIETIGVDDDFFNLGGHSLLATQVIARIRQIFDVNLTLTDFFTAPTIRQMADHLLIMQLSQLDSEALENLLH